MEIKFDFEMLVAANKDYVVGQQYWMGIGVEFDNSESIWVNDIAFELGSIPVSSHDSLSQVYDALKLI